MKLSKLKIFLFSLLLGFAWVYGSQLYKYKKRQEIPLEKIVYSLNSDVFLAPHFIKPKQYTEYKTIIDMQPDDEVSEPYKVKNMRESIRETKQSFHYIPVPRDSFPDHIVEQLTSVLTNCEKPVLLYCRSGKRAVKTYALSLASTPGGPDLETIIAMVKNAGQDASDIKSKLQTRIADRNKSIEN